MVDNDTNTKHKETVMNNEQGGEVDKDDAALG